LGCPAVFYPSFTQHPNRIKHVSNDIGSVKNSRFQGVFHSFILMSSHRERSALFFVALIQIMMSLVDLLSIFLLGIASSLQFNEKSNVPNFSFLEWAGVNTKTIEKSSFVIYLCVTAFALLLVKTILSAQITLYILRKFSKIHFATSIRLYQAVIRLPITKLQKKSFPELNQIFSRGIEVLTIEILAAFLIFFSDFVLMIVMLTVLLYFDFALAISLLVAFVFSGGMVFLRSNNLARQGGLDIAKSQILSEELMNNTLVLYRELSAADNIEYFKEDFSKNRMVLSKSLKTIALIPYLNKFSIEIVFIFAVATMFFYQYAFGSKEELAFNLVVFIAAGSRLLPAFLRVQQGMAHMKSRIAIASNTIDCVNELLQYDHMPVKNSRQLRTAPNSHDTSMEVLQKEDKPLISFKNVTFSFPDSTFSLKDLNFNVSRGSKVAIIGRSGSGKSTLIDLMIGLLQCSEGEVSVNYGNPSDDQSGLVSYVPQETFLINGSIRDNLLISNMQKKLTETQIWHALNQVDLGNFLLSLPFGLETKLGSDGIQLSGGQKQRIGLARAILRDSEIVILDEITSSLDAESESLVNSLVYDELSTHKTIITVTHKIQNVVNSDLFLHLNGGRCETFLSFDSFVDSHPEYEY
jgi:ATP-binding cassette subfamily C protein